MRNVLILASGYCGKATANGLCARALAIELEKNDVNVFAVSCDSQLSSTESESRTVSILRSPPKRIRSPKNSLMKLWRVSKNMLLHTITPKYDKPMAKKMLEAARQICNNNEIDAVLCMYFPLEAVLAGYELKKAFPNIKYFVYELDSVADGISGSLRWNKSLLISYKRLLKRIYKAVDLTFVLKCHEKHWLKENKCFEPKMRLVDLPLLESVDDECSQGVHDGIKLLYSGALDASYRSPDSMLKIFEGMEKVDYRIDFYSKGCEDDLNAHCKKDNRLICHGYVEKSVLEKAVEEADILLSIGNKVSNSLPSKIITYTSYGKPIIHFSLQKEDVCKWYFEKYPLALVIESDEDRLCSAKKIEKFIELNCGKKASFEELRDLLPMNLPSYSVKIMLDSIDRKDN